MKPTFDARFLATVVILVLLLSFQFLLRAEFWGGGMCSTSLPPEEPTESYPLYEGTTFGWPFGFISVTKDGCFADRKTQIEWIIPSILIDAFWVGGLSALPYGIPWLRRRWRKRTG